MKVIRRVDHSSALFFQRTVAAQLHALGLFLTGVGACLLLPRAWQAGLPHFWACFSFVATGAIVFLVSSTYHFLNDGFESSPRLQALLENIDHCGIYLFIAGTYSPFLLNAVTTPWQTPLLIAIWLTAISGLLYTCLKMKLPTWMQSRALYTSLFVLMGFIFFIRVQEIVTTLTATQLGFFIAGSLAYSLGAVVYATQRPKLFAKVFGYHELWHLLVLLGASMHFAMIFSFYRRFNS